MEKVKCPYCTHENIIAYEDILWSDGDVLDKKCSRCEKIFEVHTYNTVGFAVEEKDD